MRLRPLSSSFLLLLLSSLSTSIAKSTSSSTKPDTVAKHDGKATSSSSVYFDSPTAQARALVDVPIDGKDGKPHAGPFVETNAERERKQAASEESSAPDPNDPTSEHVLPGGAVIPSSNDGVMDDKNRQGPKEGTRGTEGGVSEKTKDKLSGSENKPDPPKAAPPLPHSEQQKIPGQKVEDQDDSDNDDDDDDEKEKTDGSLEKPEDLPDSPHDIPPPSPPGRASESLEIDDEASSPEHRKSDKPTNTNSNEIIQPFHSFVLSLTMILFSEIGDKTFLVAALMAMRHPRMVVFSSAFTALIAMTVLSAILGHAVPTILPVSFTNIAAAVLFFVFGIKMLFEAKNMAPDENVSQEMKEVEMELEEKEHQQRRMNRRRSSVSAYALESGRAGTPRKSRNSNHRLPSPDSMSSSSSRGNSPSRGSAVSNAFTGINNLLSLLLSPAWVQTFVMTFLGEWGDRSQIATIAMAAGQDYWFVTMGAIVGHGICTAAAVIGGRAIAGKVSIKVVTLGGAVAFLIFGMVYLFEAIY